ncbi:hypothetical protein NKG05_16055 [Oerskovia sp. M15]
MVILSLAAVVLPCVVAAVALVATSTSDATSRRHDIARHDLTAPPPGAHDHAGRRWSSAGLGGHLGVDRPAGRRRPRPHRPRPGDHPVHGGPGARRRPRDRRDHARPDARHARPDRRPGPGAARITVPTLGGRRLTTFLATVAVSAVVLVVCGVTAGPGGRHVTSSTFTEDLPFASGTAGPTPAGPSRCRSSSPWDWRPSPRSP